MLLGQEPNDAFEKAKMLQQMCQTSSHLLADVRQKFDANVQIATTVNVFEIWSHFIPAHLASAPRTSHTIKKTYNALSSLLMNSW